MYIKVWSFSPPEDVLYEAQPTMAQRMLHAPPRPLSAVEYRSTGTHKHDQPMSGLLCLEQPYTQDDIDMADVGPSTAPLQRDSGPTFFHDD
jgi:F-box and WD-40 domain protein CDC4